VQTLVSSSDTEVREDRVVLITTLTVRVTYREINEVDVDEIMLGFMYRTRQLPKQTVYLISSSESEVVLHRNNLASGLLTSTCLHESISLSLTGGAVHPGSNDLRCSMSESATGE